jgi:hypothetical protein
MSIQAVAWALDQDLPARPKLVLVSIANHANHTDGYCWLRLDTIAAEASCSRRAVFNFIGDLIRNGYIRKAPKRGDDGRQRANDYWILLHREPAPWIGTRPESASEEIADDDVEEATEPQDVEAPGAPDAPGCDVDNPPEETPEVSPRAPGPGAPACTHRDSEEPSKIKPEEDARARAYVSRHYHPPPLPRPQPLGEVIGRKAEQIFVFKPSEAYRAWAIRMSMKHRLGLYPNGEPRWQLETTKVVDGRSRRGWYFPSLFPPPETGDPPNGNQTEESAA